MSLYLGKSNNSNPILHITNNTNSISSMKTEFATSDTVFLSTLPYLSFTNSICSIQYTSQNYDSNSYPIGSAIPEHTAGVYVTIPPNLLVDIIDNLAKFFFVTTSNNGVSVVMDNLNFSTGGGCYYYNTSHTAFVTSSLSYSYPIVFIKGASISQVEVYVTNINKNNISPIINNGPIVLSNSTFTVGQTNILTYPYVSSSTINTSDVVVSTNNGTLQLINSRPSSGSLQILKYLSSYRIIHGGKILFDGTALNHKSIFSSYTSYTVGSTTLSNYQTQTTLLTSSLPIGNLLFIDEFTNVSPATLAINDNNLNVVLYSVTNNYFTATDTIVHINGSVYLKRYFRYPGANSASITANAINIKIISIG